MSTAESSAARWRPSARQTSHRSQHDPVLAPDPRPGLGIWPDVGDWPFVLYLRSPPERAIVEYCEADLWVRVYDDEDSYQLALATLTAEHPRP